MFSSKQQQQSDIARAINEATDALAEDPPDHGKARGLLLRAMPNAKTQAGHIYQAISSRPGIKSEEQVIREAAEKLTRDVMEEEHAA